MRGMFIIFDGIDGSGKTTALNAVAAYLKKRRKKIFDLVAWSKKHHALPDANILKPYDVIVSAEPTHAWIGAAIRGEIIRAKNYSGRDTAAAFALDRQILYTRCVIPALKMGKIILQDRSVATSIAYQPIQKNPASLKCVLNLPGNKLALSHAPDLLVLAVCPPEEAIRRLQSRTHKKDDAIFERLAFLKRADRRFRAPWFKKIWQRRGTRVTYLDTNQTKKRVAHHALRLVQILSSQ